MNDTKVLPGKTSFNEQICQKKYNILFNVIAAKSVIFRFRFVSPAHTSYHLMKTEELTISLKVYV